MCARGPPCFHVHKSRYKQCALPSEGNGLRRPPQQPGSTCLEADGVPHLLVSSRVQ
jgi:hypothetical protein